MSFSYDNTLPSYKDKVRRLVSDTVEARAVFSDEEITAWETLQANIYLAAAEFCRMKGLEIAEGAILYDTSADVRGGISVDRRQKPKWWFDRAKTLETTAMAQGVDEIYHHFAFDIDENGVDRSQYQGRTDYVDDL